jgi:hypothetical protein
MDEISKAISELGIPVVTALGAGFLFYFMLNWMKSVLIQKIDALSLDLKHESANHETMIIRLIDKVNLLKESSIEERNAIQESLGEINIDYRIWSEASHNRSKLESKIKKRNGNGDK